MATKGDHESPSASGGRVVFRLAIGAAALGVDRTAAVLRWIEAERAEPTQAIESEPLAAPAPRHVLIGAVCAAPTWLAGLLDAGRTQAEAWRDGRLGRSAAWLAHAVPDRFAAGPWRDGKARARALAEALVESGRREERAGRRLARAALGEITQAALARVAESDELRDVIAEQSAGLGASALARLRSRSARADGRAESLARRLTGRAGRVSGG